MHARTHVLFIYLFIFRTRGGGEMDKDENEEKIKNCKIKKQKPQNLIKFQEINRYFPLLHYFVLWANL